MKILLINGSPKAQGSNTMQLANAFLEGAGWADAKIVHTSIAKISPCLGCFACWNKTPGKCVISDDMPGILDDIIAADVIVWAFPLYYFSVPGPLKNLIDRQLPLNLPFMSADSGSGSHPPRYDLSRQRHVLISSCGFWTSQGNYESVISLFDHTLGNDAYARIFCGQGELFCIPELKSRTDEYLKTVQQAGAEFAKGGISAGTQAQLAEPLYPRDVFEKMADASWGVAKDGKQTEDDSLRFTTQMSALYVPDGASRVLEFHYTDIDKTYQLLLTPQGAEVISEGLRPYTTRIETPYEVWRAIARGDISGPDALFQNKYRVLGSFDVMLAWDKLFGAASPQPTPRKEKTRKTDMSVLLVPWIIIWIAFAINGWVGGIIGIAAASLLPLAWLVYKPVIFEQISVPLVAGLSLLSLLGAPSRIIVPVSYGIFGLMWFVTVFAKTPLTAHYSSNSYGGDAALQNPLFMRTNRILTGAWGVLYLLTPIWTYLIMGTPLSVYTGLINSLLPALMGAFTMWFQKWYPAWMARGKA